MAINTGAIFPEFHLFGVKGNTAEFLSSYIQGSWLDKAASTQNWKLFCTFTNITLSIKVAIFAALKYV